MALKINGAAIQQVRIRNTKQFTAAGAEDVKWSSSNEKIFAVDNDGLVKGVGTGSAKLAATAGDESHFVMVQVTA